MMQYAKILEKTIYAVKKNGKFKKLKYQPEAKTYYRASIVNTKINIVKQTKNGWKVVK